MKLQIPKLRFSEFSDKWDVKKLGEITSLITKGTTPSKFVEIGIKFVKIECLEGDYINIDKCLFIDEGTHLKELKRSILNNNDILFAIAGATIGKCCIVSDEVLPANTNQALSIIRLKDDENVQFTFQILTSSKMKRYILDNISVGAQPNLNLEQMGNFTFFVPFREEQTKIANFLTTVDEKIQTLKEKKRLLEEYKKGLMQKIFSQEIRFKKDDGSDFGEWEDENFKNMFTIGSGKDYKHLKNGDVPVFGTGGYMTSVDKYLYDGETVCIGRKGTIDKPMFYKGKIWTVDTLFYTHTFQKVIPKFVFYIFNTVNWKEYNEASGVPSLSKSTIEKIQTIVPPLPEQKKIVNFLTAIDEKIEKVGQQIEISQTFKKGLLQQMFV